MGNLAIPEKNLHRKYHTTVVGGTFDRLHDGHRALLLAAVEVTRRKLICGVTHPSMNLCKIHADLIEPLDARIQAVSDYLWHHGSHLHADIIVIKDKYGPAIDDPGIDAIVITIEGEKVAQEINEIREHRKLKPLEIVIVPLVMTGAPGDQSQQRKISSTAIRSQLMDEDE